MSPNIGPETVDDQGNASMAVEVFSRRSPPHYETGALAAIHPGDGLVAAMPPATKTRSTV
jgi:hypothetical protein